MDEDGEDLTPFWLQSNTNLRRGDRLRRGVSAVFFSSGVVVFLLLVTAVCFLVFVVPSTLSFSAQIFRPNSVKKSWDSLNIVLVLVAVVFGFLSRNRNGENNNRYSYYHELEESQNKPIESEEQIKSNVSTSNQWYDYSGYQPKLERKISMLRRNSNSYPDLREFSSVDWSYGDYQRRSYDDIHVDPGRVSDPGQLHRRHRSLEAVDYLREPPQTTKTIIVDTLVSKSKEATNFPSPLPPVPPPTAAEVEGNFQDSSDQSVAPKSDRSRRKVNKDAEPMTESLSSPPQAAAPTEAELPQVLENPRRYEKVARRKERSNRKRNKDVETSSYIATTPPPIPPPPPPPQRSSKSDKKRGGATGSATKDFFNSIYSKKKKKQRQKSVDNFDSLLHEPRAPLSVHLPPPSPPPPPPPPSVLQNLFLSKKQKRKRTITVTLSPPQPSSPPPPPPPPPRRGLNPNPVRPPSVTHKPPKPIRMNTHEKLEENSNSGGESPLNRIPPPPPPPPPAFFKSPTWKFVVQGDYVRVNSNTSSRSGSPDPDDVDSDVTPSASGEVTPFHPSPLYCPSPDVNTKAESFISNFRAKLKLEKIHSMNKRDLGLSSLGPGLGPTHN